MKKRNNIFSARNVSYLAVLTALVVVLQAFVGSIPIGVVQLNFSLIPIVLGGIFLGATAGAVLGFVCGMVVFIQVAMGLSPFYTVIWAYAPAVTFFTCTVKTTVAGWIAGLLYKLIAKKNSLFATFVASGIVPVVNTALFIVGCLCMTGAIGEFQSQLVGAGLNEYGGMNVFVFIVVGLVTFNFFVELAINLFLSPAICRVEGIVNRRISSKYCKKEEKTSVNGEGEQEQ